MADAIPFRATDGYRFYVHRFQPIGESRGRVLIFHGIRSHAGWYGVSCATLAERGFEVHLLERRGSGWNTTHRGDAPSFERLNSDAAEYLLELRRTRVGLSLFVAGISWGAKLAVALAAQYPTAVAGLALIGPGLKPRIHPPLVMRLRIALAAKFRPTKFFPIPLNDPELFTASSEWQKYIGLERHGLREATARFLFESFRFDRFLRNEFGKVTCPVLLQLAGRDRIVDNLATRRMLVRFHSAKSITLIDYPTAHHTLEFESPGHAWFLDWRNWMERIQ